MKSRQKKASRKPQKKVINYSPNTATVTEWVIRKLKSKSRFKKEISVPEIQNHLRKHYRIVVHGATLRSIIHKIRLSGRIPLLIANGNGYYRAKTTLEITEYLNSLQRRIRQIGAIKKAIDLQAHTIIGKQYKTKARKSSKKK